MKRDAAAGLLSPPRAILFDLDGTLVDSYPAIQQSINHVRSRHGLAPLALETVKAAVGNGLAVLLERTCPTRDPEDDAAAFLRHHPSVLVSGTRLLPGVRRTVAALSHRGCLLGVCSNKPLSLTRKLLKKLEFERYFAVVLGPESVGRAKPAPDMLEMALRKLKVPGNRSLYVGDMTIDVETARRAGIASWVIASGTHSLGQLQAARPDHVLGRIRELLDVVPRRARS